MAFKARLATADDAEIVAWHRVRMFQEMGLVPDNLFEQFRGYALDQLRQSLDSGEYIGWLVPAPGNSRRLLLGLDSSSGACRRFHCEMMTAKFTSPRVARV